LETVGKDNRMLRCANKVKKTETEVCATDLAHPWFETLILT